jgi:hypothetical protein
MSSLPLPLAVFIAFFLTSIAAERFPRFYGRFRFAAMSSS